jgi:vitamin B12 transporter
VVDAEKIAKVGNNNLVRLLESVFPGRTPILGGPGTQTSLFINGARSKDTVVLLDGISVTSRDLGLNMSNFGLTGVDRVEISLGPSSTLYGSDAHGGVVSMSGGTPSEAGFSGYVLGQAGTLGQMRLGALALYSWDSGWLRGAGDADQSPSSIKTVNPYRQSAGYLGFGQQFGESWLVKLNHRSNYVGAPTPFNTQGWPANRNFQSEREALVWQSFTTASLRGNFTDSISAEANFGKIGQENLNDANIVSSPSNPKLDRTQGNVRATWKSEIASVTLLGDMIDEELRTNFYNPTTWDTDRGVISSAKHTAFVLEGSVEPTPILRFVGSVRSQKDTLNPYNDAENSIDQTTWKAGANLLLPSGLRAYASTGTSFNTPSLSEMNTNIKLGKELPGNESSRSILAGIGYEHNRQWWLRADASRISYNNAIEWRSDPITWDYFVINVGELQVQGLELAAGMRDSNWDAEFWVRSQEGRQLVNENNQPVAEEDQLRLGFQRRPFFSAGIRANCMVFGANLGANLSYIGNRYDYPIDASSPTANKTTLIDLTLRGSMNLGKSLTVTLLAERLLQDGLSLEDWQQRKDVGQNNVSYAEGFPLQGRSVSVELRYKF